MAVPQPMRRIRSSAALQPAQNYSPLPEWLDGQDDQLFELSLNKQLGESVKRRMTGTKARDDSTLPLDQLDLQQAISLSRTHTQFEQELLKTVRRHKPSCYGPDGFDVHLLAQKLYQEGYLVQVLCHAKSAGGQRCPSAKAKCLERPSHTYIYCSGSLRSSDEVECVVEPQLREQFSIAHPSSALSLLLSATGPEFVGKPARLQMLAELLSSEIAAAFARLGLPLPPWRRTGAVLSKWGLSPVIHSMCAVEPPPCRRGPPPGQHPFFPAWAPPAQAGCQGPEQVQRVHSTAAYDYHERPTTGLDIRQRAATEPPQIKITRQPSEEDPAGGMLSQSCQPTSCIPMAQLLGQGVKGQAAIGSAMGLAPLRAFAGHASNGQGESHDSSSRGSSPMGYSPPQFCTQGMSPPQHGFTPAASIDGGSPRGRDLGDSPRGPQRQVSLLAKGLQSAEVRERLHIASRSDSASVSTAGQPFWSVDLPRITRVKPQGTQQS